MAYSDQAGTPAPKRGGLVKLGALGLVLAAMTGGGGFHAVQAGWIDPAAFGDSAPAAPDAPAFVSLEPIVISLPSDVPAAKLRLSAKLEVDHDDIAHVEARMPRVVDALNDYLHAVDPAQLGEPAGLIRLRVQMLRRVQMVTEEARIRDFLVSEFILD